MFTAYPCVGDVTLEYSENKTAKYKGRNNGKTMT